MSFTESDKTLLQMFATGSLYFVSAAAAPILANVLDTSITVTGVGTNEVANL
jgi:hypothetical protein